MDLFINQQAPQTTSGTLGRSEQDRQRNIRGGPCYIERGNTNRVRSRPFFSSPTGETSFQNNTQQFT